MSIEITAEQRIRNREKLANFLMKKVSDEQFDMSVYRADEDGDEVPYNSKTDCGTVGCALGWGPFVVKPKAVHYAKWKSLSFQSYAELFVIFTSVPWVYGFLFDGHWTYTKYNTRLDAVHRLKILNSAVSKKDPNILIKDEQFSYFIKDRHELGMITHIAESIVNNEVIS